MRIGQICALRCAWPDQSGQGRLTAESLTTVTEMIIRYRGGGRYDSEYQIAWQSVALKDLRVRDDAWPACRPAAAGCTDHRVLVDH